MTTKEHDTTHPIVDTHVHFFGLQHPVLKYVWLEPEFEHPDLGNIDSMKSLSYDANARGLSPGSP